MEIQLTRTAIRLRALFAVFVFCLNDGTFLDPKSSEKKTALGSNTRRLVFVYLGHGIFHGVGLILYLGEIVFFLCGVGYRTPQVENLKTERETHS